MFTIRSYHEVTIAERSAIMTAPDGTRKLYKSRTDRMIDGVCGGIAEYFGIDPTLVRVTWVLLTILGGSGILLYIAGMIIMPTAPLLFAPQAQGPPAAPSNGNHKFWGILLVVIGVVWLLGNLDIWHRWWDISWDWLLPTLLILAGVGFLFGGRNYIANQATPSPSGGDVQPGSLDATATQPQSRRLFRTRLDRKLFGVCGGIGNHLGIDPTIIRILLVVSAFASFGLTLLVYAVMAILVPEEPLTFNTPGATT
jgi:phage shock protein C